MEYLLTHTIATDRAIPTLALQAGEAAGRPRVFVQHGLGSAKEQGLYDLYRLAQAGFVAVAVDARLHGERTGSANREALLNDDFARAMQEIVYGTADDISHLLSEWGDGSPAGFIGISAGGMVGHVLATGERRIAAMACCISSPDWLTADPRVAPPPDSPEAALLAAISPVNQPQAYLPLALAMMNGEADDVVTPIGSTLLMERLRPLYAAAGLSDRLLLRLWSDLGHVYSSEMSEMAVQWMQRFLS